MKIMNQAALSVALDTLERALATTLEGWVRSPYEPRTYFSKRPDGSWLKVRFCSHAYETVVRVSCFDGVQGSPVVTEECRTPVQVVQQLKAFRAGVVQ